MDCRERGDIGIPMGSQAMTDKANGWIINYRTFGGFFLDLLLVALGVVGMSALVMSVLILTVAVFL